MTYSLPFFERTRQQGLQAGHVVTPIIEQLGVACDVVLDLGGGMGGWLEAFTLLGAEVHLADQLPDQVAERLHPAIHYYNVDLCDTKAVMEIVKQVRPTLVLCTEVVEHLPPDDAERLLSCVADSVTNVIWSAAWKGQGGEHHINERPEGFWATRWADRGFLVVDVFRQRLDSVGAPRYYRSNLFLATSEVAVVSRGFELRLLRFASDCGLPDRRDWGERFVGIPVSRMPASVVTRLVRIRNYGLGRRLGENR